MNGNNATEAVDGEVNCGGNLSGSYPMYHAIRISESLKANPSPPSSEFLHTVINHFTAWFCPHMYR